MQLARNNSVVRLQCLLLLLTVLLGVTHAFVVVSPLANTGRRTYDDRSAMCVEMTTSSEDEVESNPLLTNLKMRFRIFQESRADGDKLGQTLANVLAGEYDADAVRMEIKSIIESEPCVMFTWERSPSCVSAVKALNLAGAKFKNVRLDDPWEEGSPIRAELGKMVGKSSVPCIFIGGVYIGGYDAGVSDDAPGLLALAFQGELRPKLEAAGAL